MINVSILTELTMSLSLYKKYKINSQPLRFIIIHKKILFKHK